MNYVTCEKVVLHAMEKIIYKAGLRVLGMEEECIIIYTE